MPVPKLAGVGKIDDVPTDHKLYSLDDLTASLAALREEGRDSLTAQDLLQEVGKKRTARLSSNSRLESLDEPIRGYLREFAGRHSAGSLIDLLEKARGLKILVVGETIIDEYQYCHAIGKSGKEPTLVVRSTTCERFAGGILAVANHLARFSDNVRMLTVLGSQNAQESFVRESLDPRVEALFHYRDDAPTIVKRRFIEEYFFTKMLEVYEINQHELSDRDNELFCEGLDRELAERPDLVVVVDYGHGLLRPEAIELLSGRSPFLALNTQANAGNLGYHTVSMYHRADYVTSTEGEMRLEARNRRTNLRSVLKTVAERLGYPRVMVTRGKSGCLGYQAGEFVEIPAVADRVVDRIGAGDAFLAVSSLCAVQGAPLEVVGLVGNAAGAQSVATVCNREPVSRAALYQQLETLLGA